VGECPAHRERFKEKIMSDSPTRTIAGVTVYAPTGAIEKTDHPLAPRLRALKGARVGILDNHKEFSDLVLRGVAEALRREHGVEVTFWRKDYLGRASPYAQEMAANCDAVVNGVGH
jgi:hypothetical protein